MKTSFCINPRTAAYLSKEGMPCLPGIPYILKEGTSVNFIVVHPEDDKVVLSVPVELPETLHLSDGTYALLNGVATYAGGLLTFSHGSMLAEM